MYKIADITSSKRIYRSDYVQNGIPFYRSKEVIEKHKNKDVTIDLYISNEKFLELDQRFGSPKENDILLTSVGTLGIPYKVGANEKFYFKDGNLTWFRKISSRVSPDFLYSWLTSNMAKNEFKKCTIGSSQPALTIIKLKNIKLRLPNFHEQIQIASILSGVNDKIKINQKIKMQLLQLKKGLMQDLLSGKKIIH
ncbi:MAG: hypothetical protein AUJ41_02380 [Candidatus Pacebacteria bacterium CG1_02_43_31]|nr:MAG: hypothetical protein AUJ41_02380 [Candidatus Pacebacteria bacterium CG1_02_43_31]